jgi:hypothetical protein
MPAMAKPARAARPHGAGAGVFPWILLGAALGLQGCDSSPGAPTNVGYCWRLSGASSSPGFTPVSNGVGNLESCAAHLEALSLREKRPTLTGAFQGQYIFITPQMVQSSMRLDGARYRLFDASTRGKIDADLRWMLEDERHGSDFAPHGADGSQSAAPPHPPRRLSR